MKTPKSVLTLRFTCLALAILSCMASCYELAFWCGLGFLFFCNPIQVFGSGQVRPE